MAELRESMASLTSLPIYPVDQRTHFAAATLSATSLIEILGAGATSAAGRVALACGAASSPFA